MFFRNGLYVWILFSLLQKPYGCQVPGCSKRYTDPSSLRKHVKNHSIAKNKKKSRKSVSSSYSSSNSSLPLNSDLNDFNNVKSEKSEHYDSSNLIEYHNIIECSDFTERNNLSAAIERQLPVVQTKNESRDHYLDINEICQIDRTVYDEEFVSIENIKKYLGEQNMDYIDVTLQNHLNTDYYGGFL